MSKRGPIHPGLHIRQAILPAGLSVKNAAQLLGVGRPALSNLLNGKASLSPAMAVRIERAFGANSETLLQMQASYDEAQIRPLQKTVAVRTYTPGFLDITASQITGWSDQISARSQLPAFLRRLVLSTGQSLSKVDFPAFDNAERPGWDGMVETDTATPWIPQGVSGWEFGCNQDSRQKANHDYAARVTSVAAADRKEITFVFVTPRIWQGKEEWAHTKKAEGLWKDVRALDASDLEQWVGESIPAQGWMAERLGLADQDILSLDQCWDSWANVTQPPLHKDLFQGAVESHKYNLEMWIKQPPARPFVVTADSEEEALAFIACAFESMGAILGEYSARVVALRSVSAFRRATRASSTFLPIIVSPEVEEISAGIHRTQHTVIVRRRNAVENKPDIALDLIDNATFKKGLMAMGVPEEEIPLLERASGQSATILRRRLSDIPAIKFPPWTRDTGLTRKLVPLGFAGAWHSQTKADQEILSYLSDCNYSEVEKSVTELLRLEQSPLWSVGRHRGVISKLDVLYGIRGLVTSKDLENFFFIARLVLSERDPSLDLPEGQRYAAGIYGKVRDHSKALRDGICETLVLLAVHGDNLFRERLGLNVENQVIQIVRELLMPPKAETWASQRGDLPLYAEAAPDLFLDILENDLKNQKQVLSLLKPVGGEIFGGSCPRAGLLWALELLAWKAERLFRVASLLAQLSETKIDDNWVNKPENSLKSIFRSWMPQTAASLGQRIAALEALARRYPQIAWRIIVTQFTAHETLGNYSYRPQWRKDASGAGQPVAGSEHYEFVRKAIELAIDWPHHSDQTLGDLVERIQVIPNHAATVWDRIRKWAAAGASDQQKALLRERIRRYAFTIRGRRLSEEIRDDAREVYDLLAPNDPVVRSQWLFAQHWVEESADELEADDFDYQKREQRISKLRAAAIEEIWKAAGYNGVLRLCLAGNASSVIGWHLGDGVIKGRNIVDFIYRMAAEPAPEAEGCLAGFLSKMDDEKRENLLVTVIARFEMEGEVGDGKIVRLLRNAPFRKSTWRHVDLLGNDLQAWYWSEINPGWPSVDSDELQELIGRLLAANRPRAALSTVRFEFRRIETPLLIRLLNEAATKGSEPPGHYRLRPYEIVQALNALDQRADVTPEELAYLEFLYLGALEHDERGLPNLERQLAQSPELFMQAIALSYARSDKGEDPLEWQIANEEARSNVGTHAYRLLHSAKRIPGTRNEDGKIEIDKLKGWIADVRALCKTHAREEIGDNVIGELLSKSKTGADGVWPCEAIREVLEEVGTERIAEGMAVGRFNQRGAYWGGRGGEQEREIASEYRKWSGQLAFSAPFTSRLLERIAKMYDSNAEWHDADADLRRRIE